MLKYVTMLSIALLINFTKSNEGGEALDYTESDWPSICMSGRRNSPIDFPDMKSTRYINSTDYIKILSSNYDVTSGKAWSVYHGYKFWVNLTSNGYITVKKNLLTYRYNLVDMHLHVKSEHTFKGLPADMELHLVHSKDTTWLASSGVKNDPDLVNKYLVIGILFKAGGEANPLITQFDFKNLKSMTKLDLSRFAQPTNNFYHYEGGLTTPACDEAVNWVVLQNIEIMSNEQADELNKWVEEHYKNGNARMTRPLYTRQIYFAENTKIEEPFSGPIIAVIILSIVIGLLVSGIVIYSIVLCSRKDKVSHAYQKPGIETEPNDVKNTKKNIVNTIQILQTENI